MSYNNSINWRQYKLTCCSDMLLTLPPLRVGHPLSACLPKIHKFHFDMHCRPPTHVRAHTHNNADTSSHKQLGWVNIQLDQIAMGIYTQSYGPLATDFVNYVNNSIQIWEQCWHLSTQPSNLPPPTQRLPPPPIGFVLLQGVPEINSPPTALTTQAAVVVSNLCAAHC